MKKLVIANDHAAVALKNEIKAYLEEQGYEVVNLGTDTNESCHYPVYGYRAAKMVSAGEADAGILCPQQCLFCSGGDGAVDGCEGTVNIKKNSTYHDCLLSEANTTR